MYDRLLVASDGSEDSVRAAARVREIAEGTGVRVTLAHVIGELETGELGLISERELEGELKSVKPREGRELLEEIAGRFEGSGVETTTERIAGRPHRAIHDHVERTNGDLVVVGTAGRETLTG